MNNKDVNIFFSCGERYVPFFGVALQSIVSHASKARNYIARCLYTNNISEEFKNRLIDTYSRDNMSVEFVDVSEKIKDYESKFHTRDYYTKSTYYRLFIPELYPELDKAVYLDCDIVLLDDVAKLYDEELGDDFVGAVPDESVQLIDEFKLYSEKRIGVESYRRYFNAGVLLLNCKKLREIGFESKFISLIDAVTFNVAQDQDYLNAICKGNVKFLSPGWDKMPIDGVKLDEKDLKLIHYNLSFKPWLADGIKYEEYFWKYSDASEFASEIREKKEKADKDLKKIADEQTENLIRICKEQADDEVENARIQRVIKSIMDRSPERLEIIKKIKEYEKKGWFDKDVENDPEGRTIMPGEVDYTRKKISSKIMTKYAYFVARRYLNGIIKSGDIVVKKINGLENFANLKSGAIITCNHFSAMDSFAMQILYDKSGHKKRKMFKVIKEGNYTSFPGFYGLLMRNCYTLPLSSNMTTMKEFVTAVNHILREGNFVLIYPEQAMWWNYRKPRPLKKTAFKIAAENDVPVLPVFITMKDGEKIGPDGFPTQEFTINVGKPIYRTEGFSDSKNAKDMMEENFGVWKKFYEEEYNLPLQYNIAE